MGVFIIFYCFQAWNIIPISNRNAIWYLLSQILKYNTTNLFLFCMQLNGSSLIYRKIWKHGSHVNTSHSVMGSHVTDWKFGIPKDQAIDVWAVRTRLILYQHTTEVRPYTLMSQESSWIYHLHLRFWRNSCKIAIK